MRRFFALLALLGLSLSLMVHVTALIGINAYRYVPCAWLLHIGIFIVFIPLVFVSRRIYGNHFYLTQLRDHFPGWVVVTMYVIIAYSLLNFILFSVATAGGSTSIINGKYILQNHGHFIREITADEHEAFEANDLRGLSGHWIALYFMSFASFMFFKKSGSSDKKIDRTV